MTSAAALAPVRATVELDGRDLRVAGGLMLAAAFALPFLPEDAGLPCPLRSITGIPCPLCGMTTSVVAATHLRLDEAVAANPAGIAVTAAAVAVLACRPRRLRIPALLVYLALLATWIFELHRFSLL